MVRAALVSVVQQPDVANRSDLVSFHREEWLKVLGLLNNVWEPDHRWVVALGTCQILSAQFHLVGVLDSCVFYQRPIHR